MARFETLAELGGFLDGRGIEVVDPGIPLTEWSQQQYGPAWSNQPSVRKVVGFIARNLASTPLHIFELQLNNDRKRVRDGVLAQLLGRPSRAPGMTPMRFWERLLIDGLLHDRYCALIVEHGDGPELVRLPASRVRFKNNGLGLVEVVKFTSSTGQVLEIDPADCLIDVGYSERGAGGTSPLKTLSHVLQESMEAVEYRRSIWKNGARVPLVIERPLEAKEFKEGAFERFRLSWQRFVKGGGQEGGTPILEDGMTARELNAFRPKDTLDLEGRKLTDVEVAAAYYIAPELVGAREGTFSNIKAFKEMLYGPNLGPYFEAWNQQLNASLRDRFAEGRELYIEPNIESKMRGSFADQIDYLSTAVGAPIMTRNEARPLLNLSQVEGGDELVTPLNVLIGGQASPQDGKAAAPPAKQVEEVLARFADRQAQVLRSKSAAGAVEFDRARWERELTTDLSKAGVDITTAATIARQVNGEVEAALLTDGGPHEDEDHG